MDPRLQIVVGSLERHWIALAGIAAAALLGSGAGKALAPNLYQEPQPAQLISGPAAVEADETPVVSSRHLPEYVVGTDAAHSKPAAADGAYLSAAYGVAETPDVYAHTDEAVATNAVADTDRQQGAANVDQAASSDSTEVYPAMAPG
jgi:hypothetical protein